MAAIPEPTQFLLPIPGGATCLPTGWVNGTSVLFDQHSVVIVGGRRGGGIEYNKSVI